MSNYSFKSLDPALSDSSNTLLAKMLSRLQLNANVAVDTPATNVAITNTPLPVRFSTAQEVQVINAPAVTATIANASIAVTSDDELEVITHEHQKNHDGRSFHFSEIVTPAINTTYYWMLTTPASPTLVNLYYSTISTVEYNFLFSSVPVTPTGGVSRTPVCRNQHAPGSNMVTLLSGLSVAGTGNTLDQFRAGSGQTGAESQSEREWVLAHSTNYLFALTPRAAAGNLTMVLHWYLDP